MAWNPSPEVQVARDVAIKLGELSGERINRVVIIYTRGDGKMGSISYGATVALCSQAKSLADALWKTTRSWFQGAA